MPTPAPFHACLRSPAPEDHRGVDLISDALPFGGLWYDTPDHAALAGFAGGYNVHALNRAGDIRLARLPEIRRAIPVEPEIRRAIPVDREIRKEIPIRDVGSPARTLKSSVLSVNRVWQ